MDEEFCKYLLQAAQNKKSSESAGDGGDQFDPFINLIAPKGEKPKWMKGLAEEFEKINPVDTESVLRMVEIQHGNQILWLFPGN